MRSHETNPAKGLLIAAGLCLLSVGAALAAETLHYDFTLGDPSDRAVGVWSGDVRNPYLKPSYPMRLHVERDAAGEAVRSWYSGLYPVPCGRAPWMDLDVAGLRFTDDGIAGDVVFVTRRDRSRVLACTLTLERQQDGSFAGTWSRRFGKEGGKPIGGNVSGQLKPDESRWAVKLEGVIPWREPGRDYVWLALEREGGRITGVSVHAMKTYNKIAHPVDRSGLTITDTAIRGTLSAVLVPDRYVPTDLSYVRMQTTIDATIGKDGTVEGTHAGRWDLPYAFTGKAACRVLPESEWGSIVQLGGQGWPQFLGPTGANFISSPLSEGVELVDDLNEARLVWVSDERQIGAGKSGTNPYWLSEPSEGFASPIVHRGKVFIVHFKGRGPAWDQSERGTEDPARRHYHYIDADDIILAIDAATGRTVWQQVFQGRGINRPVGKRGGFAITPVGHGERLYATTTTGLVYAFEADTGEVLWQSPLPLHEEIMQAKAEGIRKHVLITRGSFHGPMAVIGGVLVVSDLGDGLVGLDLASGRQLWHRENVKYSKAAPTTFVEGGRQYILVARAHPDGAVRLIGPKSGADLWTFGDLAPCQATLPTDNKHTIAFVPSGDGRQKRLVGLQISTKGAEKLWEMPEEYRTETSGDAAPAPVYAIKDGILTGRFQRRDGKRRFFVRMSDGKVLAEAPGSYGAGLHYGDAYVISPDPFHTPGISEELVPIAMKKNFREGGCFIRRHRQSGGYSVPQIRPFVNGFMFVRTGEGFVACYDLRAGNR